MAHSINHSRALVILSLIVAMLASFGTAGCAGDTGLADTDSSHWVLSSSDSIPASSMSTLTSDVEESEAADGETNPVIPELPGESENVNPDGTENEDTEPQCEALGSAMVRVETSCSWGACPGDATVVISSDGDVLATGDASELVEVPAGCFFDVHVTLDGLADAPTYTLSEQLVTEPNAELSLPLYVETSLLRLEAHRDGRNVAAIGSLHRFATDAAEQDHEAAGTLGANGESVEVSAGRYLLVVTGSGQELAEVVELTDGDIESISIDFE